MPDTLTITHAPRDQQHSDYDWINIDRGPSRIGKVRSKVAGEMLTIYSINVFPEFQRHGYATQIIELFKESFDTIIADRVRPSAKGFWTRMGFVDNQNDNYIWQRTTDSTTR